MCTQGVEGKARQNYEALSAQPASDAAESKLAYQNEAAKVLGITEE
jgi:hypothetical protein